MERHVLRNRNIVNTKLKYCHKKQVPIHKQINNIIQGSFTFDYTFIVVYILYNKISNNF